MPETVKDNYQESKEAMGKATDHLESELQKIRAGKASPVMLEGVMVDYYGTPTPVNQVANINVLDARSLSITPWEKPMIEGIEKAILQANLGVTPQNDGENIKIYLPPLTEERRTDLVKQVNATVENGKISIRNIRRDAMENIKKMEKDGLSEDESRSAEDNIQKLTDEYTKKMDDMSSAKEKEIMTI